MLMLVLGLCNLVAKDCAFKEGLSQSSYGKEQQQVFKTTDMSKNRLLGTDAQWHCLDNWRTSRPFQWTESEFPELFLSQKANC
jgi:hypothetical protein